MDCGVMRRHKEEMAGRYFNILKGVSMREIREGMEEEKWVHVDAIPMDAYQVVGYLMEGRGWGMGRRVGDSRRSGFFRKEEVVGNTKIVDLKIIKN